MIAFLLYYRRAYPSFAWLKNDMKLTFWIKKETEIPALVFDTCTFAAVMY